MEWQPIETAPKDGTKVLLYQDEHLFAGMWFEWDFRHLDYPVQPSQNGRGWLDSHHGGTLMHPTHWMPLPEPPKELSA